MLNSGMANSDLLKSFQLGELELPNRIVMAPLTRKRATDDMVPVPIMETYYEQRSTAGLIISEATNISPFAVGYANTPGIYSSEQVRAWKTVTEGVHRKGGRIFLQLWHTGRISHPDLQPGNALPVAPSAVAIDGKISTPGGIKPFPVPRELDTDEIRSIVGQYEDAAVNAIKAGFDGVEIHGANGYLPHQFLVESSNRRSDQYGGSIRNRSRFLMEIIESVVSRIGHGKTGLRLSPAFERYDIRDTQRVELFEYLINEINRFDLAYLHLTEPLSTIPDDLPEVAKHFRPLYKGVIISCGGYDLEKAEKALAEGIADLIAFGRPYISNPDLVKKISRRDPFHPWDESTFYKGGERGYIDY